MGLVSLAIALICILSAVLIKENSIRSIIGYNQMTESEKKEVDTKGLSTFLKRVLSFTGASIVSFYLLLSFIRLPKVAQYTAIPILIISIAIVIIELPKYKHNFK